MRLRTKVVSLIIENNPITIYGGKNNYNGAVRAVPALAPLVVGSTPRLEEWPRDGAPGVPSIHPHLPPRIFMLADPHAELGAPCRARRFIPPGDYERWVPWEYVQ